MNYRQDKYGNALSILGYGCMRFPQTLGVIDMEETEKQVMAAIRGGVNYFDTAYIYPGSEAALGQILHANGVREQVKIATKLPHYLMKNREKMDALFAEELKRLKTDYVDFYLMHMLTDDATWERLKALGIEEWIAEKKASGQIRQIGFSYHGGPETFCRLVDAYDWDFCQIQYNYMDDNSQAGRRGLQYAAAKGLPVIIMEPLRGGRLVNNLPEGVKKLFAAHTNGWTAAQWSLRWLWDQPEVTVVLSGMNSLPMIEENMQTASQASAGDLTQPDQELLQKVVKELNARIKVGCTGCGYCQPCPAGVDIPGVFAAYNRKYQDGTFRALKDYFMCTTLRTNATAASGCIGCGKCEKHCPQHIEIRKELKQVRKELEGPVYQAGKKIAKWFTRF